jgi:hypothetical protein
MELLPEWAFGIELLNARYSLSNFDSGDEELNDFLRNDAQKEQQLLLSKTHLCFHKDRIAAFITLAADSIRIDRDKLDQAKLLMNVTIRPTHAY